MYSFRGRQHWKPQPWLFPTGVVMMSVHCCVSCFVFFLGLEADTYNVSTAAAANPGVWTWRIGQNDNIDEDELERGTNYVLILRDPSGDCPSEAGWVDCQLQSRAFKIKSNITTTSTLSPTSSTTLQSSMPSTTAVSPTSSAVGLSTSAKAAIGVGAGVGGPLLVGLGVAAAIYFIKRSQRRRAQKQMLQSSPTNTSHAAPEVFQVGVHHQPRQGGYSQMYKPLFGPPRSPGELPAEPSAEPICYEMDVGSAQARC